MSPLTSRQVSVMLVQLSDCVHSLERVSVMPCPCRGGQGALPPSDHSCLNINFPLLSLYPFGIHPPFWVATIHSLTSLFKASTLSLMDSTHSMGVNLGLLPFEIQGQEGAYTACYWDVREEDGWNLRIV